jgi:hypothetical protein
MHVATLPIIAVVAAVTFMLDADHKRTGSVAAPLHAPPAVAAAHTPLWGSPPINFPESVMASLVNVKPISAPPGSELAPAFKPSDLSGWNQLPTANSRVNIIPPTAVDRVSDNGSRIW